MGFVGVGRNAGRVIFWKKRARLVYRGIIEIHSRGVVGSRGKEMMRKGKLIRR